MSRLPLSLEQRQLVDEAEVQRDATQLHPGADGALTAAHALGGLGGRQPGGATGESHGTSMIRPSLVRHSELLVVRMPTLPFGMTPVPVL